MRYIATSIYIVLIHICCDTSTSETEFHPIDQDQEPVLKLVSNASPFLLELNAAEFFQDIAYDSNERNVFDYFMPNLSTPSSLCIIIHGGGFVSGDKSQPYSSEFFRGLINNLISNNVAVASINYRFIQPDEAEGLIKCLNDAKRALQYMKYYSSSLNFKKQKVVLMGSSAGAGTSLWIGLNDDMSDSENVDEIERESTRIQGIVATATQANYDFLEWHNNVFDTFESDGFGIETIINIMTEPTIMGYYGVNSFDQLSENEILVYRDHVNMLKSMSGDDPEFYIATSGVPYSIPTNTSELYHHPLHVNALMERASQTNAKGIFYCPELEIDTRNGENIENFILRKIGTQ